MMDGEELGFCIESLPLPSVWEKITDAICECLERSQEKLYKKMHKSIPHELIVCC